MIALVTAHLMLEALRQSSAAMNEAALIPNLPEDFTEALWRARLMARAAIAQAEKELTDDRHHA